MCITLNYLFYHVLLSCSHDPVGLFVGLMSREALQALWTLN